VSGPQEWHAREVTAQPVSPAAGPDADPGLFGPDSVTWRVHADPSMALAGLRALLLQALHPLAMAGVAQHSDFRADPWGRLFRTAEYVGVTTYGTTLEAQRAAARVRGIHRRYGGVEPESGTAYRVDDPDLLLWVHCCEVASFLSTAVRCGLRLSRPDQDRYYAEQRVSGELVGIACDDVPSSVAEMAAYFRDVQPALRATEEARRTVRFVLWPPMPALLRLGTPARPVWTGLATAAFAMLPRWARRHYAMPGLPTTDVAATAAGIAFRTGLLAVPERLRHGPHLKKAQARLVPA
jgi:uncharacterized protein (DUF2236 family)